MAWFGPDFSYDSSASRACPHNLHDPPLVCFAWRCTCFLFCCSVPSPTNLVGEKNLSQRCCVVAFVLPYDFLSYGFLSYACLSYDFFACLAQSGTFSQHLGKKPERERPERSPDRILPPCFLPYDFLSYAFLPYVLSYGVLAFCLFFVCSLFVRCLF